MKDPCKECLVQVTCWQECDEKRNYTTLLRNAISNFTPLTAILNNRKQRNYYRDLYHKNQVSRTKISERLRTSMSQEN